MFPLIANPKISDNATTVHQIPGTIILSPAKGNNPPTSSSGLNRKSYYDSILQIIHQTFPDRPTSHPMGSTNCFLSHSHIIKAKSRKSNNNGIDAKTSIPNTM